MKRGIVMLMGLALQAGVAVSPAAAQSVVQRQPSVARQPVDNGRVVLSEHEGTLVWRALDDKAFTFWTLANYVAPIVWFSPDEPLLRAGAHVPQRLPPLAGSNPLDSPSHVYYTIPLVLIHDTPACASIAARFNAETHPWADEDLAWNDTPGAAASVDYPPLDCLDTVKIRFFFYYSSEVGVGAHFNDFESFQVNVRIERNRPLSGNTDLCTDRTSGHCAFVTGVFGSAHGIAWYTNGLNVDANRDTLLPISVLVEEGKHASAPDRNGDGAYTPGFDVDIHPNDAWGVRDILRTRWLQGPTFRSDMAKRRLDKDRVFPPVPNWRLAETWVVRTRTTPPDPGVAADAVWHQSQVYELTNMRKAIAGVENGTDVLYCDANSDRLSPKIPDSLGCETGLCESLRGLVHGEEGCQRTRVFVFKGWPKLRQKFGRLNIGGTHDEYLTWSRLFGERVMPGIRISGTSKTVWWIPPVAWNVPGLDGWVTARWNVWRSTADPETPREGPVDVVYSQSAARYLSFYMALGRDTLPASDSVAPGKGTLALEGGFKWRFEIPLVKVFSGVRVGVRSDDPRQLRHPRLVVEFGGGSW